MRVNQQRLSDRIELLATLGATADGGVTRLAFSDEDRAAVAVVGRWLAPLGSVHALDSAGNHTWRFPGTESGPAVLVGSHLDTVPNGGRFDGVAGVVAAAELIETLHELGLTPRKPLEVVVFSNEEGSRFPGGLLGSQALCGLLDDALLDTLTDSAGITLREAMRSFGVAQPSLRHAARPAGSYAAFFELHVEQATVLEENDVPVGILSGIAGLWQMRVEIRGRSGHAGAMPMALRRDPLVAAAHVIQFVDTVARESEESVRGTVGWIEARPGADNVIPDTAAFTIDFRGLNRAQLDRAVDRVLTELRDTCTARRLEYSTVDTQRTPPVHLDAGLRELLEEAVKEENAPAMTMPSWSAHDAMIMQGACPTAMVFVRSRDGLSHCPEEFSTPEDLAAGAELLLLGVAQAAGITRGEIEAATKGLIGKD